MKCPVAGCECPDENIREIGFCYFTSTESTRCPYLKVKKVKWMKKEDVELIALGAYEKIIESVRKRTSDEEEVKKAVDEILTQMEAGHVFAKAFAGFAGLIQALKPEEKVVQPEPIEMKKEDVQDIAAYLGVDVKELDEK